MQVNRLDQTSLQQIFKTARTIPSSSPHSSSTNQATAHQSSDADPGFKGQVTQHDDQQAGSIQPTDPKLDAQQKDSIQPTAPKFEEPNPESTNKSQQEKLNSIEETSHKKAAQAGLAPKGGHSPEPKLKIHPQDIDDQALTRQQEALVANGYDQVPVEAFAGFWIRFAAYAVDWILIYFITRLLFNLLGLDQVALANGLIPKLASLLIYCLYFTLATASLKGQTPGKILFNLRVVPLNGPHTHLTFSALIIREFFGRVICYYVPWLMVLLIFTNRHQHPIDLLSDTSVINEKYLQAIAKWQIA